jgi:hypothetical protein
VKSEEWNYRLKGIVFQGPQDLIMMELNQARIARLQCSKHCTSGSRKNTFHQFKHELFGFGGGRWKRAISGDKWDEDKRKLGYSTWMEDKLVDALYNIQPVLDRYMKLQTMPMNNEELAAFKNNVEFFCGKLKN